MADISEQAFVKAGELVRECTMVAKGNQNYAFARFIQQVSDAAKEVDDHLGNVARERLAPFILPDPVDPLESVLKAVGVCGGQVLEIRNELAARGYQIVGES